MVQVLAGAGRDAGGGQVRHAHGARGPGGLGDPHDAGGQGGSLVTSAQDAEDVNAGGKPVDDVLRVVRRGTPRVGGRRRRHLTVATPPQRRHPVEDVESRGEVALRVAQLREASRQGWRPAHPVGRYRQRCVGPAGRGQVTAAAQCICHRELDARREPGLGRLGDGACHCDDLVARPPAKHLLTVLGHETSCRCRFSGAKSGTCRPQPAPVRLVDPGRRRPSVRLRQRPVLGPGGAEHGLQSRHEDVVHLCESVERHEQAQPLDEREGRSRVRRVKVCALRELGAQGRCHRPEASDLRQKFLRAGRQRFPAPPAAANGPRRPQGC